MRKIAFALLGGALVASTVGNAQTADGVQLYGRFNVTVESDRTTDATVGAPSDRPTQVPASAYTGANRPSRSNLTSNGSAVGIRGSEHLGGDLIAWFQMESGVPVDAGDGVLASRNTALGLRGKWGNLFAGKWDTPYKAMLSRPLGFFRAVTNADYTNIIGNPAFGVPAGTTRSEPVGNASDAAFDRRQGNIIQYWTPSFRGIQVKLAHSVAESKSSTPVPITPDINSVSIEGAVGKLRLGYAYEEHNDYFGLKSLGGVAAGAANRGSKDTGHRILATFTFGDTTVAGTAERLEYENSDSTAGNVNRYERDAYFVSVAQKLGRSELWASYGSADSGECSRVGGATCNANGLGGEFWTLAAKYNFSRRTFVYAYFTQVENEASARYGVAYYAPPAPGGTTQIFALGMNHDF